MFNYPRMSASVEKYVWFRSFGKKEGSHVLTTLSANFNSTIMMSDFLGY